MNKFNLKIWRLHPISSKIIKAEKTLKNTANPAGVKFCHPYSCANSLGFWAFSPVDIDILWKGEDKFEHKLITPWEEHDRDLLKKLIKPTDDINLDKWCPPGGRTRFTWGAVEPGIVQLWTGIILQCPPSWSIHVRSPINWPKQDFRIQEGVIEADWLQYDIWFNIMLEKDKLIKLRRDTFPPLAQLIPVKRETYDNWQFQEETLNRDSEEANKVFEFYCQYNQKKFAYGGKQALSSTDPTITKDATTYFKERKRILGKNKEPKIQNKQNMKKPKIKNKLIS